jgi:hypothetical protein
MERNFAIRNVPKLFKELDDVSEFPAFYSYYTPLERGLWILWVAKERLDIRKLSAEQIAAIARDALETSINPISIIQAFRRAGDKVYAHYENKTKLYEIMKPGKDFLLSNQVCAMQLYYFEPDKPFTSKRILSKNIMESIKGELEIVDPYCNERTLDILKEIKDRRIKFLTRIENLNEKKKARFLRELDEFKLEYDNTEFRNYPYTDIHDRYIISSDYLVLLGHSIGDLGSKESFAVLLDKNVFRNVAEALIENFNRRWKQSTII